MASTSNPNPDTKRKEGPPLPNLTPEQIQQIIGALTGGEGNTKKPKIKEPSTFHGERDQLRGWLAQLSVYFKGVGWELDYNNDKIVYALSLLRGDALKLATPYIERRQDATWSSWDDFKNELEGQFREIDEQGGARAKLMRMAQGSKGATEYWNEYRLMASHQQKNLFLRTDRARFWTNSVRSLRPVLPDLPCLLCLSFLVSGAPGRPTFPPQRPTRLLRPHPPPRASPLYPPAYPLVYWPPAYSLRLRASGDHLCYPHTSGDLDLFASIRFCPLPSYVAFFLVCTLLSFP